MVINCPGCYIALNVPDEAKGRQVRCTGCGHVFTLPADGRIPVGPAPQPTAPYPQPRFMAPGFHQPVYGDEVYNRMFDLQCVDPNLRAYWMNWQSGSFSTAAAIVLDIVTCGLFGLIYYGLKFGELPKASHNDFGAGKAIGFMFIPYYALYWQFRFWYGLCDRINLQIRLRGQHHLMLPRELATTVCVLTICSIVPYLGILAGIGGFVCREILISKVQKALNDMANPAMAMPGPEDQAWQ